LRLIIFFRHNDRRTYFSLFYIRLATPAVYFGGRMTDLPVQNMSFFCRDKNFKFLAMHLFEKINNLSTVNRQQTTDFDAGWRPLTVDR